MTVFNFIFKIQSEVLSQSGSEPNIAINEMENTRENWKCDGMTSTDRVVCAHLDEIIITITR